jgi:hypothetical protein
VALNKVDVLSIGRGSLVDNTNAAIVFTSNNPVITWSSLTNYAQYNCVEYASKVYRSKIAGNLNNQPNISPNQWEVLYSGTKDGDIAVVVAGSGSNLYQRVLGVWSALGGTPATIALNDNQVTPADAIVFVGLSSAWAKIEYTIRRGAGHARKRKGELNILNNTIVTDLTYGHTFMDFGTDIGVSLTVVPSGTNVAVKYTSTNESVAIEMKWLLSQGWT